MPSTLTMAARLDGMHTICRRLKRKFKNSKFPICKINKAMLIDGHIWCKVTRFKIDPTTSTGICMEWSAWSVYDVDKRLFSGYSVPNKFVQHNQYILSNDIALKSSIYLLDADGYVTELDTKSKHLMSHKGIMREPIKSISLSNLIYTNGDNIYSRKYSYNTRTQSLKRPALGRLVQDSKTGHWYSHSTGSAERKGWIYCNSGNIEREYHCDVWNNDGDERKINEDFITIQMAENAVVYDDHLFYFESQRKIFTLDFSTGAFCDVDLSEFGINEAQKCTGVIIEQYNSMLNMILLWFMIENSVSDIYIPKDVYHIIELYHGNYYDLRLHLFHQWIYDDQKLKDNSYHTSISLGVVINTYLKNADVLRIEMEKNEIDDETDDDAISEWEDY